MTSDRLVEIANLLRKGWEIDFLLEDGGEENYSKVFPNGYKYLFELDNISVPSPSSPDMEEFSQFCRLRLKVFDTNSDYSYFGRLIFLEGDEAYSRALELVLDGMKLLEFYSQRGVDLTSPIIKYMKNTEIDKT